ncbi:T9SS type A sorting domain-containing protein [Salinibacter ruber]|uniref:T9SS type A sorting domain-containing protein n=1 Tax=Salinibacter ruber TaxID=146919 RepID=UPI001F081A5D|nr:T9SS type A sorting domain-containing protein [Salinibacter ruber]
MTAFVLLGIALFGTVPAAGQDDPENLRAVGMLDTEGISTSVMRAARRGITGPDGTGKNGPLVKIGSELALLYEQQQAAGAAGVRSIREQSVQPIAKRQEDVGQIRSRMQSPISPDGESVSVNAIAVGETDRLHAELRRLGLENGASAGDVVSGKLPIGALGDAARLDALQGMLPSHVRTHIGSVGSEADTAHSAYEVRRNTGLAGDGQKICAMSDSYNQSGTAATTATDDVQSGDLPGPGNPEGNTSPVDVVQEGGADGSDEGRAMLQLIHDIAPRAELGFHTAFGGIGVFAQGIRDLADAGCTVIVDDVGYNTEPFYQDGPVSNAVDEVVQNEGIPYFSSAGNDGQNSYEAPFRDSGQPGVLNSSSDAHDFDPSNANTDIRQEITISSGGTFQIFSFQWTDPSAQVHGSDGPDTDLDIALVDETEAVLAESSDDNIQSGFPLESLEYTNDTGSSQTVNLVIEKAAGPDPDEVKYVYTGSGFTIQEYDTLGPTVYGHPMAKGAMAVAAAPFYYTEVYCSDSDPSADICFDDRSPPYLESFSSKGGIPLLFDQNGGRISPVVREKPDVTGTDAIDNTFFGSDIRDTALGGVDADPHPNFSGTSAAAPNIAAIGGLIRQSRPSWNPAEIYNRLESTAADVTERIDRTNTLQSIATGQDPWSGHGFVQAVPAVPEPDIVSVNLTESDAATDTYTLSWEERDPSSIQEYQIQKKNFDGPFRTVSETIISSGNQRIIEVGDLGLGVFQFRIRWTSKEGEQRERTTRPDTVGFEGLDTALNESTVEGKRAVDLDWTIPDGTQSFSYRVERKKGSSGSFEVIEDGIAQTSYTAEREAPGAYRYRVIAQHDAGGTVRGPSEEVEINFDGAVAVFGPYPNPIQGEATVDLTAENGQTVTVEIFNSIGQRVYRNRRELSPKTATPITVDAERWSSGMYFLRLEGSEFSKTRKFVVVK